MTRYQRKRVAIDHTINIRYWYARCPKLHNPESRLRISFRCSMHTFFEDGKHDDGAGPSVPNPWEVLWHVVPGWKPRLWCWRMFQSMASNSRFGPIWVLTGKSDVQRWTPVTLAWALHVHATTALHGILGRWHGTLTWLWSLFWLRCMPDQWWMRWATSPWKHCLALCQKQKILQPNL